jgi:hypothetical protein
MIDHDKYTAGMKVLLDEMQVLIVELETLVGKRDRTTQSIFRESLERIKEQLHYATEILLELRSIGEMAWDETALALEKNYRALTRSYQYFRSQI